MVAAAAAQVSAPPEHPAAAAPSLGGQALARQLPGQPSLEQSEDEEEEEATPPLQTLQQTPEMVVTLVGQVLRPAMQAVRVSSSSDT